MPAFDASTKGVQEVSLPKVFAGYNPKGIRICCKTSESPVPSVDSQIIKELLHDFPQSHSENLVVILAVPCSIYSPLF
jgi:hypothetical protein